MVESDDDKGRVSAKADAAATRKERLAAELRANLKKRKQRGRLQEQKAAQVPGRKE